MSGGVVLAGCFPCPWWGLLSHISYFSCCHDKVPERSHFRERIALGLPSEPLCLGLKAPWEDLGGHTRCGGLNENVLCSLEHLNTCSPVGGAVWGGLEGRALPQEAHPWGWALRFPRFSSLPSSPSLLSLCGLRRELSAAAPAGRLLPLPSFPTTTVMEFCLSRIVSHKQTPLSPRCAGQGALSQQQESDWHTQETLRTRNVIHDNTVRPLQ